ncbi:NAD(P)/FAD-dependent oxidoreductase [Microbacterium sp. p3-SID336]|uniref:NAD(P)/FAD-dependent oxidoreductase n=1 Tax=Microbacterium sp. p3-SID336 TaxID=2916212 RepID=UPI0021A39771|nr:NAD(P)/FAD-dependent oxidoreductase [Microbacterium sp. p3-SID336]MCT1476643.1 NAD(P)/FAD-dependent oxidoreductase [Microbacterium sp. p3-SID336]
MYDAIVIGAGPAGLQAALTLGRMHRSALLLDSGEYRNGTVLHMHNMIGEDGTPPAELRARARRELAAYDTVEVRDDAAQRIDGAEAEGFRVTLADDTVVEGRRVVLATGIADDLPDVPGLQALWGLTAFSCPFCDGHEHAGKPIAIVGAAPRALHLIGLLGRIVDGITVVPVGAAFADEDRALLEGSGATVSSAPVDAVEAHDGGVLVHTAAEDLAVAGVFVAAASMRQRAPFAADLGLRMLESGSIEIDEFGRTSVPGVYAAGDLAHRATLPGPMASVLLAAGAGQLAAVGVIQSLLAAGA